MPSKGGRGLTGERGYSHLELILALTLILIFISGALRMLIDFSANAERMDMEEVLDSLRQSVLIVVGEHMVESELADLQRLEGTNPMLLLMLAPDNYAGEYAGESAGVWGDLNERPRAGQWYFNDDDKVLIYRVIHTSFFVSLGTVEDEAAFKLNLIFTDNNSNGRFDKGVDVAQSLKLEPLARYEWVN